MDALADEATSTRRDFEARVADLENAAREIARALAEPPPRHQALIEDAIRAVQRHIMQIAPQFQIIETRLAALTREVSSQRPPGRLPQAWYDLGTRIGHVRVAVNQWPRIEPLVRAQIAEPREKLITQVRPGTGAAARAELADAAFDHLHQILNPLEQDAGAVSLGAYADIGLPQSQFIAFCHAARRVALAQGWEETRFLDVGCGMGLKLIAAAQFFDAVAGLELDAGYAGRARDFVTAANLPKSQVVEVDGREFPHYATFNVIYLFRPVEDAAAMDSLEAKIIEALDPGSLIIAPYRGLRARHRKHGLWPLADGLYTAGLTRSQSRALRRRAEYIGPSTRPPVQALQNVWTPILDASHGNGFDMKRDGRLDHV
ncbi:MAG: class I SAM-dependent methyltransferase [Pseudomonadota bacterium]